MGDFIAVLKALAALFKNAGVSIEADVEAAIKGIEAGVDVMTVLASFVAAIKPVISVLEAGIAADTPADIKAFANSTGTLYATTPGNIPWVGKAFTLVGFLGNPAQMVAAIEAGMPLFPPGTPIV